MYLFRIAATHLAFSPNTSTLWTEGSCASQTGPWFRMHSFIVASRRRECKEESVGIDSRGGRVWWGKPHPADFVGRAPAFAGAGSTCAGRCPRTTWPGKRGRLPYGTAEGGGGASFSGAGCRLSWRGKGLWNAKQMADVYFCVDTCAWSIYHICSRTTAGSTKYECRNSVAGPGCVSDLRFGSFVLVSDFGFCASSL